MAKTATTGWNSNPDNIEFLEIVERLATLGVSQQDLAGILEVSAGQVSRMKKGERHASVKHLRKLRKHVQRLTKERSSEPIFSPPAIGRSAFEVNHAILRNLSVDSSVIAFRDLLWARATARGIPTTRVSISSNVYTADGGVDASILDSKGEQIDEDELLTAGTRYQIKTGDFAPWQKGQLQKELFGDKEPMFENLKRQM